MDVRLPDGTIIRNVPEGTTKAQIMERLGKSQGSPKALGPPEELSFMEKYVAPAIEAVGVGAIPGKAVRGLIQGGADPALGLAQLLVPEGSAPDEAIKRQLKGYEESRSADDGIDVSRLLGNVALSPFAALLKAPAAASAIGRIGQGAGVGAAGGATNPILSDDFWSEKTGQTAFGAALGGALPSAWELTKGGGRWARNMVEPFLGKEGATRSAARLANEAAGDMRDPVIKAMLAAREKVPGSKPTGGQAATSAGSAEFSALTDIAAQARPSPAAARAYEQEAARAAVIKDIAKTPAELKAAKASRTAASDPIYQAARSSDGIDAAPVAAKIDKWIGENPGNERLVAELKSIRKGLIANRKTGDLHTGGQELASVLDGMKTSMADEKNKFILSKLTEIKDDLRDLIPDMKRGDAVFAEKSRPVNQMVYGAELEKALTSGTGKERASVFANKVADALRIPELQRKTGVQRFGSIDDILDPPQAANVRGVHSEFENLAKFDDLSARGMSKARKQVGEFEPAKLANPLERTIMIINAIIARASGKAGKRTMDALADLDLDPKTFAKSMQDVKPAERQLIVDALLRMQAAASGQSQ